MKSLRFCCYSVCRPIIQLIAEINSKELRDQDRDGKNWIKSSINVIIWLLASTTQVVMRSMLLCISSIPRNSFPRKRPP